MNESEAFEHGWKFNNYILCAADSVTYAVKLTIE